MPNGELVQMGKDMESLKDDLSDLKYTLLNPEDGVIVKTNMNTSFRLWKEQEFLSRISVLPVAVSIALVVFISWSAHKQFCLSLQSK